MLEPTRVRPESMADPSASALLSADAPLWLYVGYLGDRPIATAELTAAAGVVGLYNISTLAAYRRRGFGTAFQCGRIASRLSAANVAGR